MKIHLLEREQFLPISLGEAWGFFSTPSNLNEITPDDLGFRITSRLAGEMYEGQIITYQVKVAPLVWVPWVTEIKCVDPGRSFIDEQRFGPYAMWHHQHHFKVVDGGVEMIDIVDYAIPLGIFGRMMNSILISSEIEKIFSFRAEKIKELF